MIFYELAEEDLPKSGLGLADEEEECLTKRATVAGDAESRNTRSGNVPSPSKTGR